MRVVLAPTKTMKIKCSDNVTTPKFIADARAIRAYLRNQDKDTLRAIWKCNDKIIDENILGLNKYSLDKDLTEAVFAYDGLQYKNIDVETLDSESLSYLNNSLRIISAQYGVLRPTDGIIPYRLEMQARVSLNGHTSMYSYWGDRIYSELTRDNDLIVNLCSKEYSDSFIKYKEEGVKIVDVSFYSIVAGKPKVKGTLAKMLRGRILRYMALNKINDIEGLKSFSELGFNYSEGMSSENELVFIENCQK